MKKLLLLSLLLSLSCAAAVPDTLMGIKVGGLYHQTVAQTSSRFHLLQKSASGALFKVNAFGKICTLFLQNHNGILAAVAINVPAEEIDYIDTFNLVYNGLIPKYGAPVDSRIFQYPYEAGDGHTTTAIRLGKAEIESVWKRGEYQATLRIKPDLDIFLFYAHTPTLEAFRKWSTDQKTQGL